MTGRRPLPPVLPQVPGRCHSCGRALIESREASCIQKKGRWRLVCRQASTCQPKKGVLRGRPTEEDTTCPREEKQP